MDTTVKQEVTKLGWLASAERNDSRSAAKSERGFLDDTINSRKGNTGLETKF